MDPSLYTFFVQECYTTWLLLRSDEEQSVGTYLTAATQPLSKEEVAKDVLMAASNSQQIKRWKRRKVSKAHQREKEERERKRMENRTEDTICPHCRSLRHTTTEYDVQERAADEGATPYRKCENPDCTGKPWKVKSTKEVRKKKKST